ncbi:hypothetical protein GCM10027442_05030 [Emticicia fontis]
MPDSFDIVIKFTEFKPDISTWLLITQNLLSWQRLALYKADYYHNQRKIN